jgi:hypothetical protein
MPNARQNHHNQQNMQNQRRHQNWQQSGNGQPGQGSRGSRGDHRGGRGGRGHGSSQVAQHPPTDNAGTPPTIRREINHITINAQVVYVFVGGLGDLGAAPHTFNIVIPSREYEVIQPGGLPRQAQVGNPQATIHTRSGPQGQRGASTPATGQQPLPTDAAHVARPESSSSRSSKPLSLRQRERRIRHSIEKSRRNGKLRCRNCWKLGHAIDECVLPAADGQVHGCPICNAANHSYEDCHYRDPKRDFYYLVELRQRRPRIRTELARTVPFLLWEAQGRPDIDLPWSIDFGIRAHLGEKPEGFEPMEFVYRSRDEDLARLPIDPNANPSLRSKRPRTMASEDEDDEMRDQPPEPQVPPQAPRLHIQAAAQLPLGSEMRENRQNPSNPFREIQLEIEARRSHEAMQTQAMTEPATSSTSPVAAQGQESPRRSRQSLNNSHTHVRHEDPRQDEMTIEGDREIQSQLEETMEKRRKKRRSLHPFGDDNLVHLLRPMPGLVAPPLENDDNYPHLVNHALPILTTHPVPYDVHLHKWFHGRIPMP